MLLHRMERLGLASCGIGWESWGYYAFIVGLHFVCVHSCASVKFLPFLRTIGSIWFCGHSIRAYVCRLATIQSFSLQFFSRDKKSGIIGHRGRSVLAAFNFYRVADGSINAYSPVVVRRKSEVQHYEKSRGRKSLRIAMASDMHC